MPKYEFTSDIKCHNCEATVRKSMDQIKDVQSFSVDLQDPKRPVTIVANGDISEKELIENVEQAGFHLKPKVSFLKKLFK